MTPLIDVRDAAEGASSGTRSAAVSWTDAEVVARIEHLEESMRATAFEQLQLIAEAEHRGLFGQHGARSMPAWLHGLLNIDYRDAKARVTVAREVEARTTSHGEPITADLPATAAAMAEGAIGLEHANVIVSAIKKLPVHARCAMLAEIDSMLAGWARQMSPRELAIIAERLRYLLDQDGAHRDEAAQHEARELHYATARDGMMVIKARLGRETGAKFAALVEPLAAPRSEIADASRPEAGREKDIRTAGQRNADAFAALLDLAADSDAMPRAGGQRPHLAITIDFDDLKRGLDRTGGKGMPGSLDATDQPITAENVRRIACDCEVLPMVLDGDGLPLDVGRTKRTAPVHIRAALLQRDGVCAFPGCDRPPGTPDAHHIVSWVDGGSTELSNMVMLCGHHHRTVHSQRWEITVRDGLPAFIPPPAVDLARTPRPGGRARPVEHRALIEQWLPRPRGPVDALAS
ncbi:HNH endonuclease [Saccharopolyspora indica]|uniref:HNH endonuclease signature motif containing protein n=1 Tax=Saccharopolyspora indica TaxID=1229659 RepID=UPI0022EB4CD0|nr:HNH endonuclease signature motif containing protein [Saccharopolyspora indica]MDA3643291.1 DUF222 domain-containing protein [Saccharopolyspora indica]